jgi:hypothetical protein
MNCEPLTRLLELDAQSYPLAQRRQIEPPENDVDEA